MKIGGMQVGRGLEVHAVGAMVDFPQEPSFVMRSLVLELSKKFCREEV
jgi:hypothetical protein